MSKDSLRGTIHGVRFGVEVFRWLLTLPSAIAGFLAVFFGAIAVQGQLERSCLNTNQIHNSVINESACLRQMAWMSYSVIHIGIGLAALLVVLLPTFIAPSRKPQTALGFYAVGALVAVMMVSFTGDPLMLLNALLTGGLTAWLLWRSNTPSPSRSS